MHSFISQVCALAYMFLLTNSMKTTNKNVYGKTQGPTHSVRFETAVRFTLGGETCCLMVLRK